jgi:hypothetical protein
MENEYPGLATVFSNEADWSSVVPTLLLSKDPDNVETSNKVWGEPGVNFPPNFLRMFYPSSPENSV